MPTLVPTAGSASANSYASVAEGDTYFDERVLPSSNWTGESDVDVKERALITATRTIDDTYDFEGEKASTAQALKWPRTHAFDEDGEEYDTASVPTIVKRATFELAIAYLNDAAQSVDSLGPTGLEQFDRAKVGPLEVEVNHARRAGTVPDHVRRILSPVLRSAGLMAQLVRQ